MTKNRTLYLVPTIVLTILGTLLLFHLNNESSSSRATSIRSFGIRRSDTNDIVVEEASSLRANAGYGGGSFSRNFYPLKKPHHSGTVTYSSTMDVNRHVTYRRDFNIPCNYGILAFNVGPSRDNMPYLFEVYDDVYAFSNNDNLCFLYPSWNGYQLSTEPFWNPTDATIVQVPLDKMFRISSHINKQHKFPVKHVNKTIEARGGDYVIMAKGDFYSPHYYEQLKALVNGWTSYDTNIDQEINNWVTDMMAVDS